MTVKSLISKMSLKQAAVVFSITAVGTVAGCGKVSRMALEEDVHFRVTDKQRVTKGESSKYLVDTVLTTPKGTEIEVFENTDSKLYLKFNSSDVQAKLEPGKEYDAKVHGIRFGFISWYRNIVEVSETAPKAPAQKPYGEASLPDVPDKRALAAVLLHELPQLSIIMRR